MKIANALAAMVAVSVALAQSAVAATVFSDNFSTSTLNSSTPAAPTSSSTAYQVASTKSSTSSIASGQLRLQMGATTSGFTEVQALFASPVTLANVGNTIQLKTTFTATQGILPGTGTSSSVTFGLFNSYGVAPLPGGVLANTGLTATTGSAYDTGGVADWQGYVGRIVESTGSSRVVARLAQAAGSDTTSESQDLLFDNVGNGAFDDPIGVQIGSSKQFGAGLTAGGVYTVLFSLTRGTDGLLTISQDLFSGANTSGTSLLNISGTTVAGSTPTLTFDGLAIGYRYSNSASAASTFDISSIEVTTVQVPEPSSVGLLLLGGAMVVATRRNSHGR